MAANNNSDLHIYNGDEPFVFISYAHKDSEKVMPVVRRMTERGYRVWMDLGIEAGTEWSNNIALHLRNCTAFIAFLSDSSVASENCLDEIAYAKSHKKPSLMLFLEEDVVLPEGMDMQTARFQRMYMTRQKTADDCIDQLDASDLLTDCRRDHASPDEGRSAYRAASTHRVKKRGRGAIIAIIAVVIIALMSVGGIVLLSGKDTADTADGSASTDGLTTESNDDISSDSQPSGDNDETLEMSDDLEDMTFEIDGTVYTVPMDYSVLANEGWIIIDKEFPSDTMLGGYESEVVSMARSGSFLTADIRNPSGNARPISECVVGAVAVEKDSVGSFRMAKGATLDSTESEIISLFGTANDRNVYDKDVTLVYYLDRQEESGVFISFLENGKYCMIMLSGSVPDEATETSTDVPMYLSQYRAPEELGEDIMLGIMKLDGKMYQLPAPLGEFIDAGWQLESKPSCVPAFGIEDATIVKGDVTLQITLRNSDLLQTIPENCEVVCITVEGATCEVPGGFYIGMPEKDFRDIAVRYFSSVDMYESDLELYCVSINFEDRYKIGIKSKKSTGQIYHIGIDVNFD